MLLNQGKRYVSKDKIFCEIGFGSGVTLRKSLKYFSKVIGLDISPKNVEKTNIELKSEGYKNFELYTCDILEYDNKFDVISYIHGLEHFSKDDYFLIL